NSRRPRRVVQAFPKPAANVAHRREVAVQLGLARPERPRRERVGTDAVGLLPDANLRAAGYEGHGLLLVCRKEQPAAEQLHDQFPDRQDGAADGLGPGVWTKPPAFPSGAAGLV